MTEPPDTKDTKEPSHTWDIMDTLELLHISLEYLGTLRTPNNVNTPGIYHGNQGTFSYGNLNTAYMHN